MSCAAARKDFGFSSLITQALVLSFGFGHTSVCGPPLGIVSHPGESGRRPKLGERLPIPAGGGGAAND